jgi:hypothetical protein
VTTWTKSVLYARRVALAIVWLVVSWLIVARLWYAIRHSGPDQRFRDCAGSVGYLSETFGKFQQAHKHFPPASTPASANEPPMSWRVALLPFLLLGDLQIPLSKYERHEPWNGPHNSALHNVEVWNYHCRADLDPKTNTSYVTVTGPETAFPGTKALAASDMRGRAASTILIVETTASGIHWMEPKDLPIQEALRGIGAHPGPSISSRHFEDGGSSTNGAWVGFADGSAKFLSASTDPKVLRQLLDINGAKPATLE